MGEIAVCLLGAGRMGRAVLDALDTHAGRFRLSGVWARRPESLPDSIGERAASDITRALSGADVAIDFTLAGATATVLDAVVRAGTPLVSGVSGIAGPDLDAMRRAAARIAVFHERNMSVGVAILTRAVEDAARVLGEDYAASVSDLHHAAKKDAPSGTALKLGEALARARRCRFADVMRYDPETGQGRRESPADIVFDVRREGEYPGRHAVRLAGPHETLEFCHEALDRQVFADGALRAAEWLVGREPGLYGMEDLLRTPERDRG